MLGTCIVSDGVNMREKSCMIKYGFPRQTVVLEGPGVTIIGIMNLGSNRGLGVVSSRSSRVATHQ